jgi:hypothetical protein
MKLKFILAVSVSVLLLYGCKHDNGAYSYTVGDIVQYNAQAAIYFHTIFREAENAWAFIHEKKYDTQVYTEETGASYKKIYCGETEGSQCIINIEYNSWLSGTFHLMGKITVTLPDKNVYRQEGKTAGVKLSDDFSIAQQRVTGSSSMTFVKNAEDANDHYDYKLTSASIYDMDDRQRLITAGISNGKYVRMGGNQTLSPGDDIWALTATMTGQLFDDANMKYTNTVVDSGEPVYFLMNCPKAIGGVSDVIIPDRPYIRYTYGPDCDSDIEMLTVEQNKK